MSLTLLAAVAAFPAQIRIEPGVVTLSNGLVSRRIHTDRFVTTTSIQRHDVSREYLRSVEPEAILKVDGKEVFLGGSTLPPNRAFLDPAWLSDLQPHHTSLSFKGAKQAPLASLLPHSGRGNPPKLRGKAVVLHFEGQGLSAQIRYEVYDGLPLMAKQVSVTNTGTSPIRLESIITERFSVVEAESQVEITPQWRLPSMTVFADMAFGGKPLEAGNCVNWLRDPTYQTQVSYLLDTPCLLEVKPPLGPNVTLQSQETHASIRSYMLLHETDARESRGFEIRSVMRHLAPWTADNPLMLHIVSTDDKVVKAAIDQASECGFEMAILSFGSGLNMEDVSAGNISKFRALREYADSKGIRLGGYSLLASRRIDDENDVINVKTGKTGGAIFGNSPCLGSVWGQNYFKNLKQFIEGTGFRVLEHDGNYPGDACASTNHPGHVGYEDSQWKQWKVISEFYAWCRERDVFLNVPDTYFLAGSNKTGMGYRETNWSLPREQQHVHARQNLFDGTFEKTPSMGWMFVPLVEYHGGGAAATIEPLKDHLLDYELHFANTLGYGAQACWRGHRLYDSPETKEMVKRMVSWYKQHRDILESDIVHVRRPDGRRIDFALHVNPELSTQAMVVVYNPTSQELSEVLSLPLGRAGVGSSVSVQHKADRAVTMNLRDSVLSLPVKLKAKGWTWYSIRNQAKKLSDDGDR